ncbi:hypothetical protein VP01_196g9 [Puccinia sorghi]|uniref:F-BAR domain-containing protein n=1 Tax=Puccinia sorghi TaxID=27349 RepID=A0A0L6VDN2_9BASI|nr:hypothetical protein VP01_196g9 [Puccinia sorghi]
MSRPSSRNQKTTHSRSNSRRSSLTNTINPHSQQQQPPDPYSFCNSFWGEQGYEVLQNKNRQSTKLLEDLRSWYKERAVIEEDYAKRLTKLTKTPLLEQLSQNNHLEVGGIKRALETVRDTTRQSAHSHLELAGTIRSALEKKLAEFVARRETLKKNPQAAIERLYKKKSELIELMEKSRKKYEANAIAVNGLSAQTHLVQGRDYDKVTAKLEKAQQNVLMDEREYRSHVKNLKETTAEWNMQWKGYCDLVQDLEEERIDFMRTSFWDYANGVSTICVVDDEQCEIIRKALERCDTAQDVAEFVRQARTGSDIYVAPEYVNYARGEQTPYNRAPPIHANFVRSSTRNPRAVPSTTNIRDLAQAIRSGPSSPTDPVHPPPPAPSTRSTSKAAVKRGGAIADAVAANSFTNNNVDPTPGLVPQSSISRASMGASISRAASPAEAMAQVVGSSTSDSLNSRQSVQSNLNHHHSTSNTVPHPLPPSQHFPAHHHPPSQSTNSRQYYDTNTGPPPPPASAKPTNRYALGQKEPAHTTSSGLPAPSNRPVSRASSSVGVQPPSVPAENGQVDPLVAALEKLRSTPSISSFRRSPAPSATSARGRPNDEQDGRRSVLNQPSMTFHRGSSPAPSARRSTLEQPTSTYDAYKRSQSPAAASARRSTLNEPPHGNMYQRASSPAAPRTNLEQPSSYDPYQRSSSPAVSGSMMKPPADMRSNGGRSPSPQPHGAYNRGPSPAPSMSSYQQQQQQHGRPQSYANPASRTMMGVALDGRGGVMDGSGETNSHQSGKAAHSHSHSQSSMSMMTSPTSYTGGQTAFRQQTSGTNHGASSGHHSQQPSGGYGAPRPPQHYGYVAPPPANQPPPPSSTPAPAAAAAAYRNPPPASAQPQYSMPPSQSQSFASQPQHAYYSGSQPPLPPPSAPATAANQPPSASSNLPIQRSSSVYAPQPYYQQQQPPPQPQQQQQQQQQQPQSTTTSPTGNYTESGQPILFYVRALYDYTATMAEEFSFQANDIIAITHTDPDGWWQGELMDEGRRLRNRANGHPGNVLPSNFVDLLN